MLKKVNISLLALLTLTACSTGYNKKVTSVEESTTHHHTGKHVGDLVYFDYNSSALTHHAQDSLAKQVSWFKSNHNTHATIEGHCDERGTTEYNLALGQRRADAVKKFLVHHGVVSSKLETVSYGKEKPAVMGHDQAAWDKNRRAVTLAK